MPLDRATVARIAHLARIEVAPDEEEGLAAELSSILGWIEQLAAVDTTDVEPLRSVMPLTKPWRADIVAAGGDAVRVVGNAPAMMADCFVVPKVVE